MMNLKSMFRKSGEAMKTRTAKAGGYSIVSTVIVLAILIAVNIAVNSLPTNLTCFDISAARLYSVTTATKSVVQNLDRDVTIYWVTQNGEEDSVISKLLDVYDDLSDHIEVVKKNPDVYPTFAAQYTDEDVANNSLIIESGSTYRYLAYSDIYEADYTSYYTTGSAAYSFNGEGLITSAIDYVTADDLPVVYVLTGHGETEPASSFADALESQNVETKTFSLLNEDEIPEDASAILIHAPTSDISEDEATILLDYLQNGGKLIVISGPQDGTTFTNLESLLNYCGVEAADGIVLEQDREMYAFSRPYFLLPTIEESDISGGLTEGTHYVVVEIAKGLKIGTNDNGVTVTSLLTTSDEAFSKAAGYAMTTYDEEDEDYPGPFSIAISAEFSGDGRLVWIASDYIMDDTVISYSSGSNTDFTMNAISWLTGERDAISIRSKSLDYTYLTITTSQATLLKVVLIGVIPLAFLVCGIDEIIRRRKFA